MPPGLTFLIIISIELVTLFELVIRYPEIVEGQLRKSARAGEMDAGSTLARTYDVRTRHGAAK